MSDTIWMALALMLVFEGLLPFASPTAWRDMFIKLLSMSDGQIRFSVSAPLFWGSWHWPLRFSRGTGRDPVKSWF